MSTKIYDAYRVNKIVSINELMQILTEIRSEIEEKAKEDMAFKVAGKIQYYKDLYKYYGEEIFTQITDKHVLEMLSFIKNNKSNNRLFWEEYPAFIEELKNDPYEHTKATLQVIPCDERILAMYFGPREYISFVSKNKSFEDYHYQNQVDKPKEITEEEWDERKNNWEKAIGPDYVPNRHGLTFTLLDYDSMMFYSKIICNQKLQDKVLKNAEEAIDFRLNEIRDTIECPLLKDCKLASDFIKVERSDEYKKWKEEIDTNIKKIIL